MFSLSLGTGVFFFAFIIGVIFGSFGNVLILRIPHGKSAGGRSQCMHCKHAIASYDLVPLLSYATLLGKCRHCSKKISIQYPLVELASGLLFIIAVKTIGALNSTSLVLGLSLWLFFVIAIIDAKTQGIPDVLSAPFVLLGFVYNLLTTPFDFSAPLVAAGFFGFQWIISKGKWIGSGDIILAVGFGFLLVRWEYVLICLFLSYIIGAIIAVALLLTGKKTRADHLAFGPFLAIGTLCTILWGPTILNFLIF